MSEKIVVGSRVRINDSAPSQHDGEKGTVVYVSPTGYMVCLDNGLRVESFRLGEVDLFVQPEVRRINTRSDLNVFQSIHGLPHDWHELGELGITAEVRGINFDNAGYRGGDAAGAEYEELHLVLKHDGEPVAFVNLATLCAWATGLDA